MKITVAASELLRACNVALSAIEKHSPMPVLQNILIRATANHVDFCGCNTEAQAIANVDATVQVPGKVTVPSATLRDIAKLFSDDEPVLIEQDHGKVHVKCGRSKYKLAALPADEFPDYYIKESAVEFSVSQAGLREALRKVLYALPKKDHRRALMGVNFEFTGEAVRFTATDGKQLARTSLAVLEVHKQGELPQCVVPGSFLEELLKHLDDDGPVATVSLSEFQACFCMSKVDMSVNVITGKYPDCDAVIPKEFLFNIGVNVEAMAAAAKKAGIVVRDEKHRSALFTFGNGKCSFEAKGFDVGVATGEFPVAYDGNAITVAFDVKMLMETMARIGAPEATMQLRSATAPVVFQDSGDLMTMHLLMPVKLADVPKVEAEEAGDE